jgi:DNA-binding NarL/FixJ family response regulator
MSVHTVALVDDHQLMRSGLAAMIGALDGYKVISEASDGEEFIEQLKSGPIPDIAVVDLHMPIMDGWETIEWLTKNHPEIKTLALTFDASDDAMVRAIRNGARGFMLKTARPKLFQTALDSLVLTGYYHDDSLHKTMMRSKDLQEAMDKQRAEIQRKLTDKEMRFLELVCSEDELTYQEIAQEMGIGRRTIEYLRTSLFEKFDVKSKTGLVLFAVRWGLVKVGVE